MGFLFSVDLFAGAILSHKATHPDVRLMRAVGFPEGRLPRLCLVYPWERPLSWSHVRCGALFQYFFTFYVFLFE